MESRWAHSSFPRPKGAETAAMGGERGGAPRRRLPRMNDFGAFLLILAPILMPSDVFKLVLKDGNRIYCVTSVFVLFFVVINRQYILLFLLSQARALSSRTWKVYLSGQHQRLSFLKHSYLEVSERVGPRPTPYRRSVVFLSSPCDDYVYMRRRDPL